ncbi:MAG: type II toxin-antitoxin system HicB family antitoxin [Candidatus Woesearchaeota archaeon]|nr:type II toxin-antitoxin system HicB family antitoxin [Candidatus Woesearchaeota archaeon]
MAKVNKYTVLLERDVDGWVVAKVPAIPGCYTQGKDVTQALARIREAIELCLTTEKRILSNEFIGVQQVEV